MGHAIGEAMSTNLEVYFCDLCNESVPHTDLESGKALRVKGRVIGGCCADLMRPGSATRPAQARPPDRRSGGAASALVGVVVLAGIAAAAAFLDWRLSEEIAGLGARLSGIEDRVRLGQDRLAAVEEAVMQVGSRGGTESDKVLAQVATFDGQLDKVRTSLELKFMSLDEAFRSSVESERAAALAQSGSIAELREAVDRLGRDIGALRATPRPAPVVVVPAEPLPTALPPPVSEPDLPAELQHQVLALADEDPGTRFSAVDKLLRSKNAKVLPALAPMAKDANTFVRRLTVEGLRDFRQPEAVETLLVALSDPEQIVRLTAGASLRTLTGQKLDFDDTNASTRSVGLRRWQDWWDKNRATFTF